MNSEIIERSEKYIEVFEEKSFETLTVEQQLLLLHSYYNTRNFPRVVQAAEQMTEDLAVLPVARREAFMGMIEEARQSLGRPSGGDALKRSLK